MAKAKGKVVAAVERDLAEIRRRDASVADSALAALSLALAEEVDDPTNSATSKSMCARALHDALDRLRELTPPETKGTKLDDLSQRRSKRIAGRSAAADSSRS